MEGHPQKCGNVSENSQREGPLRDRSPGSELGGEFTFSPGAVLASQEGRQVALGRKELSDLPSVKKVRSWSGGKRLDVWREMSV